MAKAGKKKKWPTWAWYAIGAGAGGLLLLFVVIRSKSAGNASAAQPAAPIAFGASQTGSAVSAVQSANQGQLSALENENALLSELLAGAASNQAGSGGSGATDSQPAPTGVNPGGPEQPANPTPKPSPAPRISKASSAVSDITLNGTRFIKVTNAATAAQRAAALEQTKTPVTLGHGFTGAEVGRLGEEVRAHRGAVAGVLSTGVMQLDTHASFAQQESLLASGAPVSISGESPAQVAHLENLAKHHQLTAHMLAGVGG